MRAWKISIVAGLAAVLLTAGYPTTGYAQSGDGGAVGNLPDPTSPGLPRQNVTGSAISQRAPGNWIRSAINRSNVFQNRALEEFGGVEYSQEPQPRRRQIFLLAFIPEAFAIINDLIQAYMLAVQTGETATSPNS